MQPIAHRCAPRGMALLSLLAATLAAALSPASAHAQTVEAGHFAVAGTVSYADGPECLAEQFHEDAVAAGAVDDPVGSYAGTLSITADGVSWCFGSGLVIDTGTFTVSISGSNGGSSIVCRDYTSPASAPLPMPGIWQRIGETLTLAADGICSIDGVDSVHEQVWQTLVFAPTGVSTDLRYTGGAVSGDLRIGN